MLAFDLYPRFHGSHLALGGGDGHSECKSHGSQCKTMLEVLLCFVFPILRNFAMFYPDFCIYVIAAYFDISSTFLTNIKCFLL